MEEKKRKLECNGYSSTTVFYLGYHGGPSVRPSSNLLPQVQCIITALLSHPIPIRPSVRCVLIVELVT
jgi:hypothetical protein